MKKIGNNTEYGLNLQSLDSSTSRTRIYTVLTNEVGERHTGNAYIMKVCEFTHEPKQLTIFRFFNYGNNASIKTSEEKPAKFSDWKEWMSNDKLKELMEKFVESVNNEFGTEFTVDEWIKMTSNCGERKEIKKEVDKNYQKYLELKKKFEEDDEYKEYLDLYKRYNKDKE